MYLIHNGGGFRVLMFHFGTEQLMWPVLIGPEGPDQPRRLLSKQSSQSWTSQLQIC